jgi:Ca2+-binding RTX toxin-like protein
MIFSRSFLFSITSLLMLVIFSTFFAFSAANLVPNSMADSLTSVINANALKPAECAGITLTHLVVIGVNTPSGNSELIVGTPASETIVGAGGADCILGGSGDDLLRGGGGIDILMGGPGNDTLNGGGGADVCYGGGDPGDTFISCSTIIP